MHTRIHREPQMKLPSTNLNTMGLSSSQMPPSSQVQGFNLSITALQCLQTNSLRVHVPEKYMPPVIGHMDPLESLFLSIP